MTALLTVCFFASKVKKLSKKMAFISRLKATMPRHCACAVSLATFPSDSVVNPRRPHRASVAREKNARERSAEAYFDGHIYLPLHSLLSSPIFNLSNFMQASSNQIKHAIARSP